MLTKRILVSHLCLCVGASCLLRVQRRSSHTWADGEGWMMTLLWREWGHKNRKSCFIVHCSQVKQVNMTVGVGTMDNIGWNTSVSEVDVWYLNNWKHLKSTPQLDPWHLESLELVCDNFVSIHSPLILNNDKYTALKIVDRYHCNQRVAGLNSGLQVPWTLTSALFARTTKKHIYTQPQACDSEWCLWD